MMLWEAPETEFAINVSSWQNSYGSRLFSAGRCGGTRNGGRIRWLSQVDENIIIAVRRAYIRMIDFLSFKSADVGMNRA